MGNSLPDLVKQSGMPNAVSRRFVFDHAVTIELPRDMWSHKQTTPLEIRSADSGKTLFMVSPASPDGGNTRVLLDSQRTPVVAMEGYTLARELATYIVLPPTDADRTKPLVHIETCFQPMQKQFEIEMQDPVTGRFVVLQMAGFWANREVYFYRKDSGLAALRSQDNCIARVYPNKKLRKQAKKEGREPPYTLDVAPGVDVALMLLACAALDEEINKRNNNTFVVGKDQTTEQLMCRHHAIPDKDVRPHRRAQWVARSEVGALLGGA
ncbi:hypothetical protein PINS_up009334 [Pythium insidiosum]|nr:hypothetical protein PINS_up009334 [Pythium insidiosum]